MKGDCNIAEHLAPKTWVEFKKWHKLACKLDLLTTEDRWLKMGNKLPKDGKNKRVKEKVE